MKALPLYKRILFSGLILCTGIMPVLTSCGGSGSGDIAGIGGTGITQGEITDFGSIFVNGVKFNTDNSVFEVDGEDFSSLAEARTAGLTEGMVARVFGSKDSDGTTGTAERVVYNDEIEGPVNNPVVDLDRGQMSFDIFGQIIIVDQISTNLKGASFPLVKDQMIEVSGFVSSDGSIRATFVENKGTLSTTNTDIEIKGTIIGPDIVSSLTLKEFPGLTINFADNPATIIDVSGGLEAGKFIEIKGNYVDATTIKATRIEDEDDGFESAVGEISLQGIISAWDDDQKTFFIGNQLINASFAQFSPAATVVIKDGLNVEVEGKIVAGTLFADEVELREGLIELKATILEMGPASNQFTLKYGGGQSLIVDTNPQTRIEDEAGDISFDNLAAPNFVKVKAIENDSGAIIATNIKRRTLDDTEIQGIVEEHTDFQSITILGIKHTVQSSITSYEPDVATSFFNILRNGDLIEIEDKDSPDGIADEVGFAD